MKECLKCGKTKVDIEFHKDRSSDDGLFVWCKVCSNAYQRDRRSVGIKKKSNADTWGNPEWVRAYNREYGKKHREQNQELVREIDRAKYLKRKERELEKLKETDPAAYERRLNWGVGSRLRKERAVGYWDNLNDRDCYSTARTANERAKDKGTEGMVRALDVYRLVADQDGLCAICKKDITRSFHLDHKIALSNGGPNTVDNLQILCGPCNVRKGNK